MRSRYSAYALGFSDYIIETTHRESPHYSPDTAHWKDAIGRFCKEHDFVGLTIEDIETASDIGYVQFIAHMQQGSHDRSFRERSSFRKCDASRWKYFGSTA